MTDRLTLLRERVAKTNLDAFLVGAPVEDIFHFHAANRRYLSGFTGSTGWLLITADHALIAVDFRYVEQAEHECPGFTVFRATGGIDKWFPDIVGEAGLGGKRIGFEEGLRYGGHSKAGGGRHHGRLLPSDQEGRRDGAVTGTAEDPLGSAYRHAHARHQGHNRDRSTPARG